MKKPTEALPSKDCYSASLQQEYRTLISRMSDELSVELLENIVDAVYCAAYIDGMKDALYLQNKAE